MYSIHIAVVDDLYDDRLSLTERLNVYMKAHNMNYTLHVYESAEEFLAVFRSMEFDVVFMDIYMNGINGLEAAAQLRAYDRDCKLVFLTSSREHIWQAISFGICHYLTKPVEEKSFEEAMKNCCLLPDYTVPTLEVVVGRNTLTLDTGKILYINKTGQHVCIHMTQQSLYPSGSFTQVTQPLLTDERFLLSIQGTLVNMDKISEQTGSIFLMQNGDQVPINMRGKKAIQTAYQHYLMTRIRGVL